jgi:predicted DNA-binding transcriptional regulator YafY
MDNKARKRDRTARLLRLQLLLWQHPEGLEIDEIAQRCSVSPRTAYRDLEALESELGVPIWEEGNKRGVEEGYFLPPVTLTLDETMNIFLAARLLQNYSHLYNPSIASTFMKLSVILPKTLRKQIQDTIEYIEKQPKNERKINNFDKLTRAWISNHSVKICYQDLFQEESEVFTIEPYSIEPAVWGRSSYVIAYCREKSSICTFKIDHILGDVNILDKTYEIPSTFNAIDFLGSAWGIYTNEELITVRLKFNKRVSKAIIETTWHTSQKTEIQNDGSIIMMLRVRNTIDFRGWILGWGDNAEVLEPLPLRKQILDTFKSAQKIYSERRIYPFRKHK